VSFENFTFGFAQIIVLWVIRVCRGVSVLWGLGGTAIGN